MCSGAARVRCAALWYNYQGGRGVVKLGSPWSHTVITILWHLHLRSYRNSQIPPIRTTDFIYEEAPSIARTFVSLGLSKRKTASHIRLQFLKRLYVLVKRLKTGHHPILTPQPLV
jgi:hypothetical protein